MIGPPLAYALAMGFGFTAMYLSAAAAFIVCGIMVWLFLPSMRKAKPVASGRLEAPRTHRRDALLLFSICTLMWVLTACTSLTCRCLSLTSCICRRSWRG
ncbi:Sugar efflux transporter B [Klebsiella pneumoniae]|nr:Sugar efflux transporter B [Klebsiella pneumoniae]